MRGFSLRCVIRLFAVVGLAASALRANNDPALLASRVIILANSAEPESVALADYYAKARSIPEANIIALHMDKAENVHWAPFIKEIYQPLQDELVKRGWIEGISSDLTDDVGRRRYAISGHHISYLVVCRGVPLRVWPEDHLYKPNPPITDNPQFRTTQGAVDSELSLLARPQYPISGFVMNPLYGVSHPTEFQEAAVVKVSRLDGPSFESARGLVDHAIEGEKFGLIGRAYVDIGGIDRLGDQWFDLTAKELERANFDLTVDRLPTTFPKTARFDAPALYFGWYAWDINGPFTEPGFKFPPGAVALHLHSFSASTMQGANHSWVAPFVARGVTATVGNVFEPYLNLTHSPPILARALLRGDNWGDAVYAAVPALSWEAIAFGDPLYRPFAISFDQQWKDRDKLPDSLYPYVVLRALQRLESQKATEQARLLAADVMRLRPSAPVALAEAKLQSRAGHHEEACQAAAWVTKIPEFSAMELPWAIEAAQDLVDNGQAKAATEFLSKHIEDVALPVEFRIDFLSHGVAAAKAAHQEELATKWESELEAAKEAEKEKKK
ncbi:MAG TPA: TIGR03790 family protein [Opitutaceae bacterium]